MSGRANILLVDDSSETLDVVGRHLRPSGYQVTTAADARQALSILGRAAFDLVVTDVRMPGLDGMELLRLVRERFADTEVVLITGYATIQGAVDAVKTGAAEYLAKPFTKDELLAAVERALEKLAAARKARGVPPEASRFGLIGRSVAWRAALERLEAAARGSRPVLLLGERGTGRRTAALGIASAASAEPVLAVGCGRLMPGPGFAERARSAASGALLVTGLDEATPAQLADLAALAKAPPPRLFLIGSPFLSHAAEAGDLERGLWEEAAKVTLPPLRDREGDVRLLATHFAASGDPERPGLGFSEPASAALEAYPWPGNVAELEETVLELRRTHGAGGIVAPRDLPAPIRAHAAASGRTLGDVEAEHIRRVLASVKGNKSRASEILGINRKTLGEKLKGMNGPSHVDEADG